MARESKPNTGVLFKNDRKESDKHPDYKGNVNVDGAEFWLDAWINEAQSTGKKYMSLKVKPKLPGGQKKPDSAPAPEPAGEFSDDIPF